MTGGRTGDGLLRRRLAAADDSVVQCAATTVLSTGAMWPPSSPELPGHRIPAPIPSTSRRPPYSPPAWTSPVAPISRAPTAAPIARFRASRLNYFKEEEKDAGEAELVDTVACPGEVCSNDDLWCRRRSPWRRKFNPTSPRAAGHPELLLPAASRSSSRPPPRARSTNKVLCFTPEGHLATPCKSNPLFKFSS